MRTHFGARIHGELLRLGFEVAPSSITQCKITTRPIECENPLCVTARPDIAAMDLFMAPTIGFDLLYAFVIVRCWTAEEHVLDEIPHETRRQSQCAPDNGSIPLG